MFPPKPEPIQEEPKPESSTEQEIDPASGLPIIEMNIPKGNLLYVATSINNKPHGFAIRVK